MNYLDNAATTFLKPRNVWKAMEYSLSHYASPGRGGYKPAMDAAEAVFSCREKVAALFDVPNPEDVVLTPGATFGLNLALRTLVRPGSRVLLSGFEHNAVVRPLHALGAEFCIVRSDLFEPEVFLDNFVRAAREGADAAVLCQISNVFGYELPVERCAAVCREEKIPLIVDAAQSAGHEQIDFSALGAAFLAAPGHKGLFGPQGVGLLLCRDGGTPLVCGGTGSVSALREMPDFLPDRLEAGTPNVPGICGLSAGLDFVASRGTDAIGSREGKLIAFLAEGLSDVAGAVVYTMPGQYAQKGVLSFNLYGIDPVDVAEELGKRGVAVRAGLHCAPLAHETAGTLRVGGTVRASVSALTERADVLTLIRAAGEVSAAHRKVRLPSAL